MESTTTPATTTTNKDIILDNFDSTNNNFIDLIKAMKVHASHTSEDGEQVFNMTRKTSRWLLHNCKHTIPTGDKVQAVWRLAKELNDNGIKYSWPTSPIRINVDTCTVEDGAVRLLALALGKAYGTYFTIDLVNKDGSSIRLDNKEVA